MILYQKVYDFMIYFFPIVERFPKHEKFTLQTQVKNSVLGHSMYSRNYSYRKTLSDKLEASCSMR